jgi:hypothetical protein
MNKKHKVEGVIQSINRRTQRGGVFYRMEVLLDTGATIFADISKQSLLQKMAEKGADSSSELIGERASMIIQEGK